jgi:TPR repeat protein
VKTEKAARRRSRAQAAGLAPAPLALALCLSAALAFAALHAAPAAAQRGRQAAQAPPAVTQELLAELEAKAADGDPDAMFGLAVLCFYGEGTAQDPARAVDLLEKGAAKGHPMSLSFLGQLYETGTSVPKDVKKAAGYYAKAAEKGDVTAELALGGIYYYGADGVKADPKRAFRHFSRAAEQGQHQAQLMLGAMYESGTGTAKDPAKSWEFFMKAADSPDDRGEGALAVGDIYISGRNPTVPQDLEKGREYYRRAAAHNVKEAAERLALLDRAQAEAAAERQEAGKAQGRKK